MLGTPQVSFGLDNPAGKAGMLYDNGDDIHIARAVCGAVALDAGLVVEIVAGLAVVAQGTGNPDVNAVYGVTVYKDSVEGPAAGATTLPYQPGDEVAVLRKGRIFAQCVSGTTAGQRGSATNCNFAHSSTLAGNNGMITSAAASAGAGTEISPFPNGAGVWFKDVGLTAATNPLVVVEVNFP